MTQKVVESLDRRFGPVIEELRGIDNLLGATTHDNFNDSQISQLQEAFYKLTGRKDLFLSLPTVEDNEQVNDDEVMDEIKVRKNYFDHVNEKIMWLFILGAFCFIVGFQPIFADISLQTNYNEATVVLFEATLSAIVGLILVCLLLTCLLHKTFK